MIEVISKLLSKGDGMKVSALLLFLISSSLFAGNITSGTFDTNFYGFVKASAMYGSKAISSYNNINMVAPTNATPQTRSQDEKGRMSFQTQQSRFGFALKKDQNIEGKFEFDLIDFNKSSPTTQMNPRVRIASITYHLDENNKFVIGQDWDLFSPTTAYTYDFVGLYFLAGNTGFMRQQLQYLHTSNQWEMSGAIGMAGNNPGTSDSDLELGEAPTYSARLSYVIDKSSRLGLSGIYSNLRYVATNGDHRDSYGANLFYEQVFSRISLKSELYYGQNLANLGSLSIGRGTNTTSVKEYGGFVSDTFKLTENSNIISGAGFAKVANEDQVSVFALATNGAIATAGLVHNVVLRAAYEYKFTTDFSWISEYSHFDTETKVAANTVKNSSAQTFETGAILKF
jgi:hypothetical protein